MRRPVRRESEAAEPAVTRPAEPETAGASSKPLTLVHLYRSKGFGLKLFGGDARPLSPRGRAPEWSIAEVKRKGIREGTSRRPKGQSWQAFRQSSPAAPCAPCPRVAARDEIRTWEMRDRWRVHSSPPRGQRANDEGRLRISVLSKSVRGGPPSLLPLWAGDGVRCRAGGLMASDDISCTRGEWRSAAYRSPLRKAEPTRHCERPITQGNDLGHLLASRKAGGIRLREHRQTAFISRMTMA